MSINITKHGSPTKYRRNTIIVVESERKKREICDERRKQRLLQVRSQSKELASQIRQNVNLENVKQLKRIEKMKEDELKNSKHKQQKKIDSRFVEFGEAHRAAHRENKLNTTPTKRPSCPITHDRNCSNTYYKPNKSTKSIDKENSSYTANTQQSDHIYPNVVIENKKSSKIQSEEDSNSCASPRKSQNLQKQFNNHATVGACCFLPICCCCHPIVACQCHLNTDCKCSKKNHSKRRVNSVEQVDNERIEIAEPITTTSLGTSSTETRPIISYDSFKKKQQQRCNSKKSENTKNLTKAPLVIMEVSTEDSDTSCLSSCTIEDTHSKENMHFSRIYSRMPPKYNAKDFQAASDLSVESIAESIEQKSRNNKSTNQNRRTKQTSVPCTKPTSVLNSRYPPKDDQSQPSSTSNTKCAPRFTKISDLLKQKKSNEQNISNNLPQDKSTQMSPRKVLYNTPESSIAKDVCTRGVCVDPIELDLNQVQDQNNINKINTEAPKKIVNDRQVTKSRVQQVNYNKHNESQKTTRKIVKNVNTSSQICELLGPKSILSSKSVLPKKSLSQKIQYYDHNNRFQKEYYPKLNNIIENDCDNSQLNAMENANIENQLQKTKDNELEILRKKSEERCQEAMEREQVRLDYEALQAKLDSLNMNNKGSRYTCQLQQDDNIFSDIRLKQLATVRQNKINTAVENILQHPIVITCPEVNQNLTSTLNPSNNVKSNGQNYQNGINLANNYNNENILNSSDSCGSILLNYVDKRTEEISNDIKISNNNEKICKLKSLLKRLNSLKSDLLNELQSNEKRNQNSTVESVCGVINEMNKEHANIMTANKEKMNLEKREKRLKKQEAILEKKLKEFFEMQKAAKKPIQQISDNSISIDSGEGNRNSSTEESTETSSSLETKSFSTKIAQQPIEIIIQVTDKSKKNVKSPCRTPRQRASLIDSKVKRKKRMNIQKISTPIRLDNDDMQNAEQQDENNSQATASTAYKSFPKCIENNLDKLLNDHHKQQQQQHKFCEEEKMFNEKPKKISTATKTPKKISKPVKKSTTTITKMSDKKESLKSCNKIMISQLSSSNTNQVDKAVNPILGHYIQRLLGMSRQSINMLGVSSSTVTTPNSSVINNSGNKSDGISSNFEKERIERLQRFIDDNYSFLSEIEESLKADQSSSVTNSSEASQKAIAEIWQKTLKQKSEVNANNKEECVKKPSKPILKKPSSSKLETSTQNDNSKLEVLGKYTELTATCAQRISELNEMINRVRQEKQKILEITLSSNNTSNSENGKNSTEYLEFADKQKQQQSQSTGGRTYIADAGPRDSSRNTQISNNDNLENAAARTDNITESHISPNPPSIVPVPEIDISENAQLEKNKLTGISRDSGISLSRPVTALGSRDSPDTRRDSKTEDNLIFEPLLKDIPKPNATNQLLCKSHLATVISDKLIKKPNKPPVALTRFSPQLNEDIPHELSTIIEIDTPGTSRLNAFAKHLSTEEKNETLEENDDNILLPLNDNSCQALLDDIEIDFIKFPTFEEYAKKHNLDLSNFDAELTLNMQKEYQKLFELTQSLKEIKYNTFQSPYDYKTATDELKELISLTDICDEPNNEMKLVTSEDSLEKNEPKYINFPTAKEYFKKVGGQNFINSSSFDNVTISTNDIKTFSDEKCILLSPCESLPDVNAELKRRNVMQHSFINQYQDLDEKNGTSDDLNSISSSSKEVKKSQHKTEKYLMSGLEQLSSATTTDKTEEIEKDLENMGMKWAQVMLQKTHRSQALSNSTASSFLFEKHLKPSPFRKNITGDFKGKKLQSSTRIDMEKENIDSSDTAEITEYGGKPLNLRDFLTQELQKRTNSSTSSSLTDDSMVNLFLRSLLGSVTPASCKQATDRKHKTSTPVDTLSKSQSSSTKNNSKSSQGNANDSMKLFSGESRFSSVRYSRSDCEKSLNNNTQNFKSFDNDDNNDHQK